MPVRSLGWQDPWRRAWQPTPVFLPGESHGQRSLAATVHGIKKNQTWLEQYSTQAHILQKDPSLSSDIKGTRETQKVTVPWSRVSRTLSSTQLKRQVRTADTWWSPRCLLAGILPSPPLLHLSWGAHQISPTSSIGLLQESNMAPNVDLLAERNRFCINLGHRRIMLWRLHRPFSRFLLGGPACCSQVLLLGCYRRKVAKGCGRQRPLEALLSYHE